MDFDMEVQTLVLPDVFAGSLDLSRARLVSIQDGRDLSAHVSAISRSDEAKAVRQILMRETLLYKMEDLSKTSLITSMKHFKNLSIARFESCGLGKRDMALLVSELLHLPCMQGTSFYYPFQLANDGSVDTAVVPDMLRSEINIKNNDLDDQWFKSLGNLHNQRLVKSRARGVAKLVLSDNSMSDGCLRFVVKLFPNLHELHLSGNKGVVGACMGDVISKLPELKLLNLDKTSVGGPGMKSLYNGLVGRTKTVMPLEMWLRSSAHPMDNHWTKLLELCVHPKTNGLFSIKHDLQVGIGSIRPREVQCHDNMLVIIWIDGIGEISVVHPETNATQNTNDLANRIVNEVNAVSLGDIDASMRKRCTLRNLYVKAFESVIGEGHLKRRVFKVEQARLIKINKFTDEQVHIDGMSGELMGEVTPGWRLQFEVTLAVDTNPDVFTPGGRRVR